MLRCQLERRQVAQLDELVEGVGLSGEVVDRALAELVSRGEVAVLRPIRRVQAERGKTCVSGRDREYYRLVRESDGDYLWEQDILVRLPVTRMADVCEQEGLHLRVRRPRGRGETVRDV